MPFETKRIVAGESEYLVQVTYTVERRQIVTVPEGQNGKRLLAETEKFMRDAIIREVTKELGGEVHAKSK